MRWKWVALMLVISRLSPAISQELNTWELVADGFSFVTAIVQAPDNHDPLFIADLSGVISVVEAGQRLPKAFIDLSEIVTTETYGQGLLGLAFHPNYAQNGFFYVTYTPIGNSPILARYRVSNDNPNQADPDSALIILQVDHASALHNGGDIAFGPDGYLYWSMGDGAYRRSPAQNLRSHLGAVLRIDVNRDAPYVVPLNNPYVGDEDALPELWTKGLRNPWRFSFDRETGDLYIADVGEAQMEEINFQPAASPGGENYGWNRFEGTWRYLGGSDDGLTFPIVEYPHDNGSCSVTGGYVYRGDLFPELRGQYVFGDYCSGLIWTTQRDDNGNWFTRQLMDTRYLITTFGQDNMGELYLGDARDGAVYRLAMLP